MDVPESSGDERDPRGVGGLRPMKNSTLLRRLIAGAAVTALAVVLWGCGQAAPTAPVDQQSLQPAAPSVQPTLSTKAQPNDWW
jgi:hypothetical protein